MKLIDLLRIISPLRPFDICMDHQNKLENFYPVKEIYIMNLFIRKNESILVSGTNQYGDAKDYEFSFDEFADINLDIELDNESFNRWIKSVFDYDNHRMGGELIL